MTVRIVSVLEKQDKIQREQQVTPTSMAVYRGWGGGAARREESDSRSPTRMTKSTVLTRNKIENKRKNRFW